MVADNTGHVHAQSAYEAQRQQVWNMSPGPEPLPHNGLLHSIEHVPAAASPTASAAAMESGSTLGKIISTYNATLGAVNATVTEANGHANSTEAEHDAQPPEGHRPIYYLSRGFPFICLAIVLLLAWHRLIISLRHKRRLRRRRVESGHRHTRLATDDPDGEGRGNDSPDGSMGRSDATLVESLPGKGARATGIGEAEDSLLEDTNQGGRGSRRGTISRHWSAWEATQRNWLYLRTIPGWLYGPESMADALCTGVYTVVMVAFALATIPQGNEFWYLYLANGMGVLAFCQCPLIIVLIQKNNPISALTGITYQKLNYLHRASSRVALFFSWAHMLLWTPRVWLAGHFRRWYIIWGLIAIFGFTGLWITSFRFVRRVAFEFFLVAHIIFTIVFIGGAILHWYRLQFWLWPCFVIWALDRLIRGCRMLWINPPANLRWFKTRSAGGQAGECTIELLGKDVILLTARRPGLKWTPGQHFFLSSPSVSSSPHETHPFSIANMPNHRDEAIFLIRVHSGFTRKLRDKLSGVITTDIPVYLEGPYGSSHALSSYSTVILVAGGTGITFLSSNLLGLLQPDLPAIPRHLHLVWHIRHASDVKWLAGILNEAAALAHAQPWVKLTLDIHVTKSGRADEPAPAVGFTDRLVEEFAPRRFSHRYSVHRERGYRDLPKLEGGLSELPSAVGSDDEGEEVAEEAEARRTRDSGTLSTATVENSAANGDDAPAATRSDSASSGSPISEADDEIGQLGAETAGGGENEDEEALLPKPIERPHRGAPTRRVERGAGPGSARPIVVDSTGLTEEAASRVFWKKGRADLREVLEGDLDTTTGPINVTVCGPVQLMHATRRAVRDVATPKRALKGDWPVDFYEETLGS